MGDKVYPVQQRHGPSAPPIGSSDGNTVAIQMPERAIRKEQEETLITNQYLNQRKERDDPTYGAWPPATAGGGHRRRRRRSCLCCCIASFCATLVTILVIVGVAALVLYLVLRPKAPDFSVIEASVNEFNLTSSSTGSLYLNTDMIFSVEAKNPNKKISLYYDDVQVKLLYADQPIGAGSIPAFHQGHRNTTLLTLPIQGHDVTLPSPVGSSLQSSLHNDVSLWLRTQAASKARVKVGGWKSRRYKLHVDCSLQLSNPQTSPGGHVSLVSKSCKIRIKVVFFHLSFS